MTQKAQVRLTTVDQIRKHEQYQQAVARKIAKETPHSQHVLSSIKRAVTYK